MKSILKVCTIALILIFNSNIGYTAESNYTQVLSVDDMVTVYNDTKSKAKAIDARVPTEHWTEAQYMEQVCSMTVKSLDEVGFNAYVFIASRSRVEARNMANNDEKTLSFLANWSKSIYERTVRLEELSPTCDRIALMYLTIFK